MPNWCQNIATFSHDDESMIAKLVSGFESTEEEGGMFDAFLPIRASTNPDWYNQRVYAWGTKWDVRASYTGNTITEREPTRVVIRFHTAWAPPHSFYDHLCTLGFDVSAVCVECGAGHAYEYNNGVEVERDAEELLTDGTFEAYF